MSDCRAILDRDFRDDLTHWIGTNHKTALRVMTLIEDVLRDPFAGIGRPEPLKHLGMDVWSRRLTAEHRLVYLVRGGEVYFLQAQYRY